MIKIFNTLGKKLEIFKPLDGKKVKFYQCGPTVYWFQHIGNLRAMVLADLIRRTIEYAGYEVVFVRNYTDFGHLVDGDIDRSEKGEDKVLVRSRLEGISPTELTAKYTKRFDEDLLLLKIKQPTYSPKASDHIKEMESMTADLLDKELAYNTGEVIYFDTSKFPKYTELSGAKLDQGLEGSGHGGASDNDKKNPADFALWFFKTGTHAESLLTWDSRFHSPKVQNGRGTPGWHIECSAMAWKYLGEQLDIHMGGVEHIPIHHTNEIAQTESFTGKKYVNYWIHNEHLTLYDSKMSKSIGNVIYLSDIIAKGYSPLDLRYFFLSSHYRSKQNFTYEALDYAKISRYALAKKLSSLFYRNSSKANEGKGNDMLRKNEIQGQWEATRKEIDKALFTDFNFPKALGEIWKALDFIEKKEYSTQNNTEISRKIVSHILMLDEKILDLGLEDLMEDVSNKGQQEEVEISSLPKVIRDLLEKRQEARNMQDWEKSDEIRNVLRMKYGYEVKDEKDNLFHIYKCI